MVYNSDFLAFRLVFPIALCTLFLWMNFSILGICDAEVLFTGTVHINEKCLG